jgi:RNA polymerase sigma-70 factor (ECF subfamily)
VSSILARVAAGDPDAIGECIDRYGGLVWTIARDFVRTAADAEDATQDVFLSLWKNAARFDETKSSEKSFIAMVARRRMIDALRKAGRRPKLVALPEDGPDPADDSHVRMERGLEASIAAETLQVLKPDQRKVIELSIYQGMSHREISELTDIPIGTVKSHIWRGLNSVRERIAELEAKPGGPAS